jgi:hypothetical protein
MRLWIFRTRESYRFAGVRGLPRLPAMKCWHWKTTSGEHQGNWSTLASRARSSSIQAKSVDDSHRLSQPPTGRFGFSVGH